MSPVTQGRLQKSLSSMTFGVVRSMDAKKADLAKTALAEREQEYQVTISGQAAGVGVWSAVELTFRLEFIPAPAQRDSPYEFPTFTYGYELETPEPVGILAYVKEWKQDDRDVIYGCVVNVCCFQPGGGGTEDFKGKLHMIFSGYGSPAESELDDDE
jgi:hypothetical protein